MFGIDDAALAMLVAGGLSTAGALYTNARNRKMQSDLNDVSIDLANTAHQREVLDLLQAGLNPILSSGGSGSSTPTLVAPSVENPLNGLANGLQGSAGYINSAYKEQAKMAQYLKQSAQYDSWVKSAQSSALMEQAEVDRRMSVYKNAALDTLSEKQKKTLIKEFRQGIVTSAKDAANQNWRNNLSVLSGALGSILNGTGGIIRAARPFGK